MNTELASAVQQTVMILVLRLIEIGVPFLMLLVALLLNKALAFVSARLSKEKASELTAIVRMVVAAVEQSGLKGQVINEAANKKTLAVTETQRVLDERGLTGISVSTISTAIEAAIRNGAHNGDFGSLVAITGSDTPIALQETKASTADTNLAPDASFPGPTLR